MRAAAALFAVVLLLAGCGSSSGAHTSANHQQPRIVARLTGKAAERVGREACTHLPSSVPRTNLGAIRAYLQTNHPTDDVNAMVKGCRAERSS
jgi:hypothetical protein